MLEKCIIYQSVDFTFVASQSLFGGVIGLFQVLCINLSRNSLVIGKELFFFSKCFTDYCIETFILDYIVSTTRRLSFFLFFLLKMKTPIGQ